MPYFIATTDIENSDHTFSKISRGEIVYVRDKLIFDTAAQVNHPKLCPMPKELEDVIDKKKDEYWKKSRELDTQRDLEIKALCLTFLREVER